MPTEPDVVTQPDAGSLNPFPGPAPYREQDAPRFFGRYEEIEDITSLVLSTSVVVLDAPSGTGKSSLISAGIIPRLHARSFDVWSVRFGEKSDTPENLEADGRTDDPIHRAGRVWDNPYTQRVCQAIAPGVEPDGNSGDQLVKLMERLGRPEQGGFVFVLDQFEELFTTHPLLWAKRVPFFDALTRGIEANPSVRLLVAIRSDYLATLSRYRQQFPGKLTIRYSLESLREDAARECIGRVFAKAGKPLSEQQIDKVMSDLLDTPDEETGEVIRAEYVNSILLQIVCRRLWEDVSSATAVGPRSAAAAPPVVGVGVGVESAMESFVDEAVSKVADTTKADEAAVREWLQSQLIGDARRNLVKVGAADAAGLAVPVVNALEEARLVRYEERESGTYAELTHDSMVRAVLESNNRWHAGVLKQRRGRRNLLVAAAAILVVVFFSLRTSPTGTTGQGYPLASMQGSLDKAVPVWFNTIDTDVTLVSARVTRAAPAVANEPAPPWLVVAPAGGGIPQFSAALTGVFSGAQSGQSSEVLTAEAVFKAPSNGRYVATLDPRGVTNESYSINVVRVRILGTVSNVPTSLSVGSQSEFAVAVLPGGPLAVSVVHGLLESASGLSDLQNNDQTVVVRPSAAVSYVVLNAFHSGVKALKVEAHRLIESVVAAGGTTKLIGSSNAAVVRLGAVQGAFSVETDCGFADLIVVDPGYQLVATTLLPTSNGTASSSSHGQFVTANGSGDGYRVVALGAYVSGQCGVHLELLEHQVVAHAGTSTLQIAPGRSYNAYPVDLPSDSVLVVRNSAAVNSSMQCEHTGSMTSAGPSRQLLTIVPGGRGCVITVARAFFDRSGTETVPLEALPLGSGSTSAGSQ